MKNVVGFVCCKVDVGFAMIASFAITIMRLLPIFLLAGISQSRAAELPLTTMALTRSIHEDRTSAMMTALVWIARHRDYSHLTRIPYSWTRETRHFSDEANAIIRRIKNEGWTSEVVAAAYELLIDTSHHEFTALNDRYFANYGTGYYDNLESTSSAYTNSRTRSPSPRVGRQEFVNSVSEKSGNLSVLDQEFLAIKFLMRGIFMTRDLDRLVDDFLRHLRYGVHPGRNYIERAANLSSDLKEGGTYSDYLSYKARYESSAEWRRQVWNERSAAYHESRPLGEPYRPFEMFSESERLLTFDDWRQRNPVRVTDRSNERDSFLRTRETTFEAYRKASRHLRATANLLMKHGTLPRDFFQSDLGHFGPIDHKRINVSPKKLITTLHSAFSPSHPLHRAIGLIVEADRILEPASNEVRQSVHVASLTSSLAKIEYYAAAYVAFNTSAKLNRVRERTGTMCSALASSTEFLK